MSFLEPSQWKQWAQSWGLVHHPQGRFSYPNEWMAGPYQGYLVKVGWGGDRGRRLLVLVRFPRVEDPATLRERLRQEESLWGLPGWKRIKPEPDAKVPVALGSALVPQGSDFGRLFSGTDALWTRELTVGERGVLWSHEFSLRRPKPVQVQDWVERLVRALTKWLAPFSGRCEECGGSITGSFVMFEGVPAYICEGCRERYRTQAQLAAASYAQEDANYVLGLAFGVLAAAVGGTIWALLAIFTGRMFAVAGIGIGFLVAWSYLKGAKKIDLLGQAMSAVLTLAGVVFGMTVLYAHAVSRMRPDVGFRLDAGWYVFTRMLRESPGDILFAMFCGVLGAAGAVSFLRRPRFTPRIEQPEEAARGQARKKAA
jgi:hypothetical protein